MPFLTSFRIIVRACKQWGENKDSRLGAALAYYALFSIAPLLVIAIQMAGAIFGEDAARGQVVEQLSDIVGEDAALTIEDLVVAASQPRGGWTPALNYALLTIGALGVFLHLRGSLCTIWKLEPPRGSTILGILLDYLLALIMVVSLGILLLLSVVAGMVVPIFREFIDKHFPGDAFRWQLFEFGVSLVFLTLLFATMYRVLSGQRIAWLYVWYGALICAFLFSLGKIAVGYYLVHSSTGSMYGAAGSLVVFLIWVYYSSQVLFFGAELIQARRTRAEWMRT